MSENTWTPIGPAPERDGVVGGDGAGQSWSVRFAHPDYPRHTLTIYVYVIDWFEKDPQRAPGMLDQWDVERMTSYDQWDRPWNGDDAVVIDGEYDWDYPFDIPPTSEEQAEAFAKAHAEDWHRNGHRYITWTPRTP